MDSDYYSTIYAWYERCGIISNVRTHLRHNLVNALKSTDMTLNKVNIGPKSAKQYVYDLLIAEYLWIHDYAYTLSVFASETPLLVNFHKHVSQLNDFNDGNKRNKLETDYVLHILETLGINPEGPSGESLTNEYATNDIPLLLSILKYISHSKGSFEVQEHTNSRRNTQNRETQTDYTGWNFSTESSEINSARKKLIRDKGIYMDQLKIKEAELKRFASTIEQRMIVLNEKLFQAKNSVQLVDQQKQKMIQDKEEDERYIYRKKLELSVKENSLIREAERLEKERDSFNVFEKNLKILQDELSKVQQRLSTKAKDSGIQTQESSTQTRSTDNIMNELVVDEEKRELQSLVREQQSRIEVLTLRAVRLSRQLEEIQSIKCSSVDTTRPSVHTVFSESSSTDEIIQDAKQRLKRLEEESHRADQCYMNCMTISPS